MDAGFGEFSDCIANSGIQTPPSDHSWRFGSNITLSLGGPKPNRKLHGLNLSMQIPTRRVSEVRTGASLTRFEVVFETRFRVLLDKTLEN